MFCTLSSLAFSAQAGFELEESKIVVERGLAFFGDIQ